MKRFFSLLQYSYGNEDWTTEQEALDIQSQDRILCITASGDRPLNLLTKKCEKIVCIDGNPVQNFLLALKAAAMHHLPFDEYVSFLGGAPNENRKEILQLLLPHMHENAANFWKKHEKMVSKGIIYQGAVERLTGIVAKMFSIFRGKKVKKLFSMEDLEQQREFVKNEWDSYLWRQIFKLVLNPLISKFLIEDPGLTNIGHDIQPGTYIYQKIHESLYRELANRTPLLSLILRGKVTEEAFSPYLTKSGTDLIKTRLSALEIHTCDLNSFLHSVPAATFDVYSLSDVASYLSYSNFVDLLQEIIRTARPGARFCLRQFLSSYEIPEHLKGYFTRKRDLEKDLEKKDNCFVYRFLVGTVNQPSYAMAL